jgi:peptidylprolyl isomerase
MPWTRALKIAPLGLAAVLLLGGCWAQDSQTAAEASGPATAAATEAATPAASPQGEVQTFEYEGVTVTGAPGAEPTVTLADDFGPADELQVADITEGEGDPVEAGAQLTVHYVGVGEQSRQVFDSSWPGGQPVTFSLDGVIQGWQQGMLGMKEGGRRLLIIPGSLAYGPEGRAPVIGEDETLVFVVDLVAQTPAS